MARTFYTSIILSSLLVLFLAGCGHTPDQQDAVYHVSLNKSVAKRSIAARAIPGMLSPGEKSSNRGVYADRDYYRFRDPATGRIPAGMRYRELEYAASISRDQGRAPARQNVAGIDIGGWTSLGPDNNGGRTRALAIDVEGKYLVSGSVSGGLFRMENHNDSIWVKRNDPAANQNVTALAQDPREGYSHIWYYATGELRGAPGRGVFRNSMGGGLYKSTDSARSWSPLTSTQPSGPEEFDSPFELSWKMVADHTAEGEGTIYLACFGGIMRSDDGGESWEMVLGVEGSGDRGLYSDVAITSDGTLYAAIGAYSFDGRNVSYNADDRGIWRSEDGVEWENITPQGLIGNYGRVVIGTAPSDSTLLYVLAATLGSGLHDHKLWRYRYLSGDGTGATGEWDDRTANIPDDPETDEAWGDDYVSFNGFCMSIDVHPTESDVVFIGGTNLYRSDNGFATSGETHRIGGYRINQYSWAFNPIRAWYFGHHPDHHGLAFWPGDPDVVLSYTDGGPHISFDCRADTVAWNWYDWGYVTLQFRSVAIDPSTPGDGTIIGGTQDNNFLVRSHEDEYFDHLYAGDGAFGAVDLSTGSMYVSNIDGNLWRVQLDAQGEPDSAGYISPAGARSILSMFPFRLDPNRSEILYLADFDRLWRNSNILEIPITTSEFEPVSTNWTELTNTGISFARDVDRITAMAPSRTPADRLYYGRLKGLIYRLDNAATGNPEPVNITGTNFQGGYPSCIAVDPRDGDRVIVVFSNYNVHSLFLTTDAGESWAPIGGNLEENPDGSGDGTAAIWCEIGYREDKEVFLLGTSTGLYVATELKGMQTDWRPESEDLIGRIIIEQIAYRESDGKIAVATHGNGLYESQVTLGVEGDRRRTNAGASLTIRPNPIEEKGVVEFMVEEEEVGRPVRLEVYDVRGVRVEERLLRAEGVGMQRTEMITEEWSSGLYLVRLRIGDRMMTSRMVRR